MFYYLLKRIFEATGTKIVDHRLPFQHRGEPSSYVNLRVHFRSSDSHEWTDKLQKRKKSAVSNGSGSLLS